MSDRVLRLLNQALQNFETQQKRQEIKGQINEGVDMLGAGCKPPVKTGKRQKCKSHCAVTSANTLLKRIVTIPDSAGLQTFSSEKCYGGGVLHTSNSNGRLAWHTGPSKTRDWSHHGARHTGNPRAPGHTVHGHMGTWAHDRMVTNLQRNEGEPNKVL